MQVPQFPIGPLPDRKPLAMVRKTRRLIQNPAANTIKPAMIGCQFMRRPFPSRQVLKNTRTNLERHQRADVCQNGHVGEAKQRPKPRIRFTPNYQQGADALRA